MPTKFLYWLFILVLETSCENNGVGILHRQKDAPKNFPFTVRLSITYNFTVSEQKTNDLVSRCSGILISTSKILSPAHCVSKYIYLSYVTPLAVLDDSDKIAKFIKFEKMDCLFGLIEGNEPEQKISVTNESFVKLHPDYSVITHMHDIALIYLPQKVNIDGTLVCPVQLEFSPKNYDDELVIAIGLDGNVAYVHINEMGSEECAKLVSRDREHYEFVRIVRQKDFCISEIVNGSYPGYATGQLLDTNFKVIGIGSFFYADAPVDDGAATIGAAYPVYTRISNYQNWIKDPFSSSPVSADKGPSSNASEITHANALIPALVLYLLITFPNIR